ncbi:MAG: MFS transporter [Pseudoflavonifractor sp.]
MQDSVQNSRSGRRWIYAVVGIIVMLFAGFVYAWSILAAPIHADFPDWSNAQLSLTFTICMAFFCLGGFVAGNLAKKIGIRANVLISAALFLVGFFLAGRTQSLGMLYVSYGVLCGTASGFAYNAVMSVMTKWFPQNQGLISGVLLMGFGSSSMVIGSAFTALTPDLPGAWRGSFFFMGVLMAAVLVLGSFFFQLPPAVALPAPKTKAVSAGPDLTPTQMIRRPAFWFFFLWAILISGIGLAVIAQAKPIAAMVGEALSPGTISFVVGLISICNGLGRVLFGGLFDRLGWRLTMGLVSGVSLLGVLTLTAAVLSKSFPLVAAGFIVTGLAYGGAPTMGSAVISSFFGQKNYPVNFSINNMNLLVASFAGTAAGALYDISQSYLSTLVILAGCCIVAFAVLCCIRRPK